MTAQRSLNRHDPELGPVCRGCGEEWPVDDEFWFFQHGRVAGRCKACWSERITVDGHRQFATTLPAWNGGAA